MINLIKDTRRLILNLFFRGNNLVFALGVLLFRSNTMKIDTSANLWNCSFKMMGG